MVIAVVDSGFSPYHLDFRANLMPQHLNATSEDDLPLHTDPADWLRGHPGAEGTRSYGPVALTLSEDRDADVHHLAGWDRLAEQIPESDAGSVHMRWFPGTKIIGAVDFGGGSFVGGNLSHGHGTSSVSVGNLHGTCPECLVVLVTYDAGAREEASDWVMAQDWIDVVTNSYGFSLLMRDRIYSGASTDLQREASERGQTILFSAGNGQTNSFIAPNTTYQSSQEGPDWIITVGATSPQGTTYSGSGKGADVSSIGSGYPSGYSSDRTIDGSGNFSGTSNATPVTAGTYGRALWTLRHAMDGPSRLQQDGVIARGDVQCGEAVPDCAAGDGLVTASELRFSLLQSVTRTSEGWTVGGQLGGQQVTPAVAETELLGEGHGTFFGRLLGGGRWLAEHDGVVDPLLGLTAPRELSEDERAWWIADSWCRQQIHGTWSGGYHVEGVTELPTPSPLWPSRTFLHTACPAVFGSVGGLNASAPVESGVED